MGSQVNEGRVSSGLLLVFLVLRWGFKIFILANTPSDANRHKMCYRRQFGTNTRQLCERVSSGGIYVQWVSVWVDGDWTTNRQTAPGISSAHPTENEGSVSGRLKIETEFAGTTLTILNRHPGLGDVRTFGSTHSNESIDPTSDKLQGSVPFQFQPRVIKTIGSQHMTVRPLAFPGPDSFIRAMLLAT